MAQQKILLAVCAFAGFVALASAQLNPMDCGQKARASLQTYSKTVSAASTELAQNLQSQGVSMIDAQKYREQIDAMMSEITSAVDFQNGFDATKMSQTYFKVLQSYVTMFRLFMNMDGASLLVGEYFKFANRIMDANSNILLQIGKDCLNANGRSS